MVKVPFFPSITSFFLILLNVCNADWIFDVAGAVAGRGGSFQGFPVPGGGAEGLLDQSHGSGQGIFSLLINIIGDFPNNSIFF